MRSRSSRRCGWPIANKPLRYCLRHRRVAGHDRKQPDYHAYRSHGHVPGDLIPIPNANHFTILDELRQPNSTLTRAVIAMSQYQTA